MKVVGHELTAPWEGVLLEPAAGARAGVVVLAGSSGRVDRRRARLLAEQGLLALAIRWFGGPGQPKGICEVPLETFVAAVELLRERGAGRVGILGVSKGAEAALLTAVHEPRVDAVVALSPPSLVWCNIGPGRDGQARPYRSSWTWRGHPLPFVPLDDSWQAAEQDRGPAAIRGRYEQSEATAASRHGRPLPLDDSRRPAEQDRGPAAIRGWYEQSEATFASRLDVAAIAVEKARADILLVAGGDDAMWPSLRYARQLAARRRAAGVPVELVTRDDAGHRPRLPGEDPAPPSTAFLHGGTTRADTLLGKAAWAPLLNLLDPARAAADPRG
ncbi:acyl-CoA thioester hydrolase/BAAT C-terminal domain-containing protein [Streptomyces sp. NPDC048416]|uniref:acyl-CoA thioester hydrolase/BAAT C-terminal domain-containing protein n=1 Tax=Streptomyces sp. NPDC048416 TaxID=3365546 RepID=UPI0037188C63